MIAAALTLAVTTLTGCYLTLDTHGMTPERERAYLARTQAARERAQARHPDRLNSLEDADHWLDVFVLALFGEMHIAGEPSAGGEADDAGARETESSP